MDLPQNRREDEVHRLRQAEPEAEDQGRQHPVQVLRVRAPGKRHAVGEELPPEPLDSVDLAVMGDQAKGLHLLEGREGVGRVAVMAQGDPRAEVRKREFGVVALQDLRRAPHLVDHHLGGERDHVHGKALLEQEPELEEAAVAALGEPRDLEEDGLGPAPHRPQDPRVRLPPLVEEQPHPVPSSLDPDEVEELRDPTGLVPGHEEVPDEEPGVLGKPWVQPRPVEALDPELPGQVGHHAGAVALAKDGPGPVGHPVEGVDRPEHVPVARDPVLLDHRDDTAGVSFELAHSTSCFFVGIATATERRCDLVAEIIHADGKAVNARRAFSLDTGKSRRLRYLS